MVRFRFRDRQDGGRQLAKLVAAAHLPDPIVLALPRGGVPVAVEVARALGAPLEVFVARKLGAPHQPEFGVGAIAEGGGRVVDERSVRGLGLPPEEVDRLAAREQVELDRRVQRYRHGRPLPMLAGRAVVLVDDGLATGVTAEAALRSLRRLGAAPIVLAVPVAAPESAARLLGLADQVITVHAPEHFTAVGQWYERFDQTSDDEIDRLLEAPDRSA